MSNSKPLVHDDSSGFHFAQEMLDGDITAAINFDRIQKHPKLGYIIFEYLLCEERQFSRNIHPYTSHPSRYWHLNSRKFISLWEVAKDLKATLYLVNYSKKGTRYEDEILLIKVIDLDSNGIKKEEKEKYTREEFKKWFRQLNQECL